jgi:hypothetical protein
MTYPYQVYFENPSGQKVVFKQGSVTLKNNAMESISVTYRFSSLTLTGKVIVVLQNLNQQIDFLLPNYN